MRAAVQRCHHSLMNPQGRPLVFLSRYPTAEDLKDGYFQRIAAIDQVVSSLPRVYLRTDGPATLLMPLQKEVADGVLEVQISRRNPLHCAWVLRKFILKARAAYAHSILALEAPLALAFFLRAPRRVLDLHGAVPEEAVMLGQPERARALDQLERRISGSSDLMIGVTSRLLEHVSKKHGLKSRPADLVLPNLTPHRTASTLARREGVIYAGGFQPWQQVEKMAEFVRAHPGLPASFLTPDPARMKSLIGAPCTSSSARPEELASWYGKHRFGLALRRDDLVNRVASPTKLNEYLRHGLVPIVDSPDIGDLLEMGYRFVRSDQALPSEEECEAMACANLAVLAKVDDLFQESAESLRAWL